VSQFFFSATQKRRMKKLKNMKKKLKE